MHHNRHAKGNSLQRTKDCAPFIRRGALKIVFVKDKPVVRNAHITQYGTLKLRADGSPKSRTYSYKGRR